MPWLNETSRESWISGANTPENGQTIGTIRMPRGGSRRIPPKKSSRCWRWPRPDHGDDPSRGFKILQSIPYESPVLKVTSTTPPQRSLNASRILKNPKQECGVTRWQSHAEVDLDPADDNKLTMATNRPAIPANLNQKATLERCII